jgi:hypothetical protein
MEESLKDGVERVDSHLIEEETRNVGHEEDAGDQAEH